MKIVHKINCDATNFDGQLSDEGNRQRPFGGLDLDFPSSFQMEPEEHERCRFG